MALFGRREEAVPKAVRMARRRARGLAAPELIPWANQALYGVGDALVRYGRDPMGPWLEEAEQGAQVLLAVVQEARARLGA